MGGNVVDKSYMATQSDKILANWRQFSVCGFPDSPTSIVLGISCTVAMPRTVHLRSYLHQSDAEHPSNVILITFVEDSDFGVPS